MGQKDGEKWTAAVDLQPTIPKSDRLLAWFGRGVDCEAAVYGNAGGMIASILIAACASPVCATGEFMLNPRPVNHYTRLLRSQSANAAHSQRSMVPVRQHR